MESCPTIRYKEAVSFITNLETVLVERPPVPGVALPPGDLEGGHDGDARAGGGAPPGGHDGDEAGESEELAVEQVVVGKGLVAHRRAGPAPGLEEKSGYVI